MFHNKSMTGINNYSDEFQGQRAYTMKLQLKIQYIGKILARQPTNLKFIGVPGWISSIIQPLV